MLPYTSTSKYDDNLSQQAQSEHSSIGVPVHFRLCGVRLAQVESQLSLPQTENSAFLRPKVWTKLQESRKRLLG